MVNFWQKLKIPFTVLAPMDGITDPVFRQVITIAGKPDVIYTEFVSCDGLFSKGRERVREHLMFTPPEHPIVTQLWGENPESFLAAAGLIESLGFDGVDINMGCPDNSVMKKGGGSALIRNPDNAVKIIKATRKEADGLPLSVKTRIGFDRVDVGKWIGLLLHQHLQAVSIHLRTLKQGFKGPVHWELVPEILKLRDRISPDTKIIANGNILSLSGITGLHKKYGCDGYMIGRGVLSNPWVFNRNIIAGYNPEYAGLELYLKHINIFEKTWGDGHNPADLKKFTRGYLRGIPGSARVRNRLMQCKTVPDLKKTLQTYRQVI